MVDFTRTRGIVTTESVINVEHGLKEGRYVLQLTVVDQDGNESKPARIQVEIKRDTVIGDPSLVDPIS